MNEVGHLTKEQLQAFAADSLPQSEKGDVGRHLLQCAICRDALPAPTPEQFWSALLIDETEGEESFEAEALYPPQSPLSLVFTFFRQPLAWGAGALIVIAGISFLIWLGASKQSNPKTEVAQTVETPKTVNTSPTSENLPVGNESQKSESAENSQPLRPKQPNINLPALKENSENSERVENRELAGLLENTPPAVSSLRPNGQMTLRGNKQNSDSATPTFNLLTPVGETVLENAPDFRWEKVPNAKNYRISILDADFNEVLTAEVLGNSFKPGKTLKPGAKYLWRVEANTESGKIVAPLPPQPPAVFRVASETAESRIESLKKNENDRLKLAVFYAQEGMLDAAACALKEILAKNPKHAAARRLLVQVERWKKENKATVQRCGPSTATKADQ